MIFKMISGVLLTTIVVSIAVYFLVSKTFKFKDNVHDCYVPDVSNELSKELSDDNLPKRANDVLHSEIKSKKPLDRVYDLGDCLENTVKHNKLSRNNILTLEGNRSYDLNERQEVLNYKSSLLNSVKEADVVKDPQKCTEQGRLETINQYKRNSKVPIETEKKHDQLDTKHYRILEKTNVVDYSNNLNEEVNEKFDRVSDKDTRIEVNGTELRPTDTFKKSTIVSSVNIKNVFAMLNIFFYNSFENYTTTNYASQKNNVSFVLSINLSDLASFKSNIFSHDDLLDLTTIESFAGKVMDDTTCYMTQSEPLFLKLIYSNYEGSNRYIGYIALLSKTSTDVILILNMYVDLERLFCEKDICFKSIETYIFETFSLCFAKNKLKLVIIDYKVRLNYSFVSTDTENGNLGIVLSSAQCMIDSEHNSKHAELRLRNVNLEEVNVYSLNRSDIDEHETFYAKSPDSNNEDVLKTSIETTLLKTNLNDSLSELKAPILNDDNSVLIAEIQAFNAADDQDYQEEEDNVMKEFLKLEKLVEEEEDSLKEFIKLEKLVEEEEDSLKEFIKLEKLVEEEEDSLEEFLKLEKLVEEEEANVGSQDENKDLREVLDDPYNTYTNVYTGYNSRKDNNLRQMYHRRSFKKKICRKYFKCKHCICSRNVANDLYTILEEDPDCMEPEDIFINSHLIEEVTNTSY